MSIKEFIEGRIAGRTEDLISISEEIWNHPELRFEEEFSSEILAKYLEQEGFKVERGIANIDTAFEASYGSGFPVIAFLGEYDALSNLSQVSGSDEQKAITENGNGHGCGHHMLGTSAMAAAIATKDYLKEHNLEGTIRFYGCPGEEGGSGKTFMAREGLFDDVDTAICWHPWNYTSVWTHESLANFQVSFKFKGQATHAAASPHLGRSGLDAVELMNVGANYLREHVEDSARFHYAITNSGGISPNVVPPEAEVLYLMRDVTVEKARNIYERIQKIAEGAALMTETEMTMNFEKACSNYIRNNVLEEVMSDELKEIGDITYNDKELAFAEEIYNTLSSGEVQDTVNKVESAYQKADETPPETFEKLLGKALPYSKEGSLLSGSTDVGDVSQITPTVQCLATCYAFGTQMHTWQTVTQGKTSFAQKGMLHASKIMAHTASALLDNPEKVKDAKDELKKRRNHTEYVCPIPDGIEPSKLN